VSGLQLNSVFSVNSLAVRSGGAKVVGREFYLQVCFHAIKWNRWSYYSGRISYTGYCCL